jgi:hypothetical protein
VAPPAAGGAESLALSCLADSLKPPKKPRKRNVDNHHAKNLRCGTVVRTMLRGLLVAVVALTAAGTASAQGNSDPRSFEFESGLRFRGGIGVIPVTGVAANGTVNLNVVRGVSPAGPWRIAELRARVRADGHITVVGRGLLLAAGNGIGTNAGASVHATLFCGPAASASAHDSDPAGVALGRDGDFTISDFLTPTPPTPCDNPVLLIRNGAGVWFAAGIPDHRPDLP